MLNMIMAACACGTVALLLGLVNLVVRDNRRSRRFDRAGQDFLAQQRLRR